MASFPTNTTQDDLTPSGPRTSGPGRDTDDDNQASPAMIRALAAMFIMMIFALTYLVMMFWPVDESVQGTKAIWKESVVILGTWQFRGIGPEMRLMCLVVFAASLGSCIHAVTSFASYVGNRTFHRSWLIWYVLRTPIGVALAMVFYFVIRGGLFSGGTLANEISPFGVSALSGMVGMFSKQGTDKLREVFDNLFKTEKGGDDARVDKLKSGAANTATEKTNAATAGKP